MTTPNLAGQRNPFAFDPKSANQNVDKKSLYIPPNKRKEMKEFLSNSSINMKHETSVNDKNYEQFKSSYKASMMNFDKEMAFDQMTQERKDTINRAR